MSAPVPQPLSSPPRSRMLPPPSSPFRSSSPPRSSPLQIWADSPEEPTSRKRPSPDEDDMVLDRPEDTIAIDNLAIRDTEQHVSDPGNGANGKGSIHNPSKKRKLTQAEREEREKERLRKEQEKQKEKEQKEKERIRKEQEKAEREKEKAEKKAALDEKKRALEEAKRKKDEEKRKKEEQKAKKERAQTRLSSFFGIPKSETAPFNPARVTTPPERGPDTKSLPPDNSNIPSSVAESSEKAPPPSDYERYFHPFFVKQHVTVAPQHTFIRDKEYKEYIKQKLDEILLSQTSFDAMDLDALHTSTPSTRLTQDKVYELFHIPPHKRGRHGQVAQYTTKQLLELINTSEAELNISSSSSKRQVKPPRYYLALLHSLPKKHLQFAEDNRPPYSGTFTRTPPAKSGLRSGKNPFERSLPNIDYDYDSEGEWIPPEEEEGEDLLSEAGDEEEEEEEDEEDMYEFLDDEGDGIKRSAGALCPLLPYSSGICWENAHGKNERKEMRDLKMEFLIEGVSGAINPFSDHYWLPPPKAYNLSGSALSTVSKSKISTSIPTSSATTSSLPQRSTNNTSSTSSIQNPKKLIPPEDLDAFKKAINGSDMTKAGLVELLKKQFPKASKDAIRETLGKVAVRMGGKEADKRWVLVDDLSS